MIQSPFKKIYFALFVLLLICLIGILGYSFIEGYTIHEAFFMTIITVSTVGFEEVRPLSGAGRYFTAFLILMSFGTFAYAASVLSSLWLDGDFRKHFTLLKKIKKIKKLENHVIICGFGRNGRQIYQDLAESGQECLILERNPDIVEKFKVDKSINFWEGDATDDQVLINAGIREAKALITTLPDDAENVFVVLTARGMNKELLITSRASKDSSVEKLRMAGADHVVMPEKVGGTHMASLVMNPDVVEFYNLVSGQDSNISLEEISYASLPPEFKNKSIRDLHIRRRSGANIIGLKTKEGEYIINPDPNTHITEGAKLFVLGMKDQIETLLKWD